MEIEEAIDVIEVAKSVVEWDYPLDYFTAFDVAIKCMESLTSYTYNGLSEYEETTEFKGSSDGCMDYNFNSDSL